MDLPIFKKCPDPTLEYYKVRPPPLHLINFGHYLQIGNDSISTSVKDGTSTQMGALISNRNPLCPSYSGASATLAMRMGPSSIFHRQFRKHPAVLARDLLILSLLHKLTDEGLHKTERLEI